MISENMIYEMMLKSNETAVSKALIELGLKKSQLSQREAFKRFGQSNVRRWSRDLKVTPHKKGGIIYYDVQQLELMKNVNELYTKQNESERP